MPAKVKVRILAGRNLPVMDKSSDASDAFVEVKLSNTTYKTEVYRRSLNPFWNSEWFRFEVSDQELQDEPLQIRIMDYDTYSANDAIGKVYINLNPLLLNPGRSMNGWLPIYDTLHGIRGEINCMVKVNLFADNNRFRHSSCGVRFFFSDIPNGYRCDAILGFVDELLVNDDPEYQWIDKIRTPRASNEARQTLFTKLSGEVQRKLGLKAEIFGGNAVIGYQQSFDLEGGSGIVGRGIGTAVVLSRIGQNEATLDDGLGAGQVNFTSASSSRVPRSMSRGRSGGGGVGTTSNRNNPYFIPNSSSFHDRTATGHLNQHQALSQKSTHSAGPHLVHSVSADYFYEVPSRLPRKKLSDAQDLCETNKSTLTSGELSDSDPETFVSLKSNDDDDDDDEQDGDDDDEQTDVEQDYLDSLTDQALASSQTSPVRKSATSLLFKRSTLNKSLTLMGGGSSLGHTSSTSASKQRFKSQRGAGMSASLTSSSATSKSQRQRYLFGVATKTAQHLRQELPDSLNLFKKLRYTAPSARPLVSVSKLMKILSNRRNSLQDTTTTTTTTTSLGDKSTALEDRERSKVAIKLAEGEDDDELAEDANGRRKQRQESSSASNPTTGSSLKRRKEKSHTKSTGIGSGGGGASLDDALSIIEEKLDDDATTTTAAAGTIATSTNEADDEESSSSLLRPASSSNSTTMRTRLASTSSGRLRLMKRAEELDLGDADQQVQSARLPSGSSNRPTTSLSGDDTELEQQQATSAISSSASSSTVLTDETIKAAAGVGRWETTADAVQQIAPSAHSSRSPESTQGSQSQSQSQSQQQQQQQRAKNLTTGSAGNEQRNRQSGASSSGANVTQQRAAVALDHRTNRAANFAQSVGVIKAQQHLLQNMIKHQNQNLVVNSFLRARQQAAALVYPGRIQQSEYPFVTLKRYPDGLIQATGGVVSVHSVKLLDHIINDEESETRDNWWTEIRKEIRSHAKSLNCNTILGYTETSKVLGDVCVLSARGTAAILKPLEQVGGATSSSSTTGRNRTNSIGGGQQQQQQQALKVPRLSGSPPPPPMRGLQHTMSEGNKPLQATAQNSQENYAQEAELVGSSEQTRRLQAATGQTGYIDCSLCHTPLHCVESLGSLADCSICGASKVPDVLLLTIEPPQNLNIASTCSLVQARVCRAKRDSHGEPSAKEIGDALPFLEYELHRQLFIGENFLTGIATGTGCFVLGLPAPAAPQIAAGKGIKANKLNEIKRLISLSAAKHRENLGLNNIIAQLNEYHKQIGLEPSAGAIGSGVSEQKQQHLSYKSSEGEVGDEQTIAEDPLAERLAQDEQQADDSNLIANERVTSVVASSSPPLLAAIPAGVQKQKHNHAHPHHHSHRHHSHRHHHSHHHHHHNHHNHNHHNHHHHHHHHRHKRQARESAGVGGGGGANSLLAAQENLLNMMGDENNIVLEVDDNEDADIIALLIDNDVPAGYMICNSELVPTINQHSIGSINMFTQVVRVKLASLDQFAQQFELLLQTLYVKLRRSLPCCLTNLNFVVDLPESHVVQITLTGCLLGLRTPDLLQQLETTPLALESNKTLSGLHQANPLASTSTGGGGGGGVLGKKGNKKASKKKDKAAISSSSMSPSSPAGSSSNSTSSSSSSSSPSSSSATSSSSTTSTTTTTTTTNESGESSSSAKAKSSSSSNGPKQTTSSASSAASAQPATVFKSKTTSLIKQSSKSNIAALLSAGRSTLSGGGGGGGSLSGGGDKRLAKLAKAEQQQQQQSIEMVERSQATGGSEIGANVLAEPTTKATIAAVKQEIDSNRLGQAPEVTVTSGRKFRAVFKKQQTYPGANSPAITGQDNILNDQLNDINLTSGGSGGGGGGSGSGVTTTAAKRASALLNKVKQPFRDLGSNFNTIQGETVGSSGGVGLTRNSSSFVGDTSGIGGGGGGGSSQLQVAAKQQSSRSSLTKSRLSSAGDKQQQQQQLASSSSLTSGQQQQQQSGGLGNETQTSATTTTTSTSNSAGTGQMGATGVAMSPLNQLHVKYSSVGANVAAAAAAAAAAHSQHQQQPTAGSSSTASTSALNSSIDITSLSYIPGAKEYHYLGNLSLSFVRETNSVRENGGLNGFIHCFLMEVYAIVRAHVSALGGNAFLSFRLQQSCIFYHSNKNQAQCLISVAGDAAQVTL